MLSDLLCLFHTVHAENPDLSPSRGNEIQHGPYGGGFSGTVGTDESENLSFSDIEIDIQDASVLSIEFTQVTDFDGIHNLFSFDESTVLRYISILYMIPDYAKVLLITRGSSS